MDKEIQFPVSYKLRVIFSAEIEQPEMKLKRLLEDLIISHEEAVLQPSSKGSFVRVAVPVTLLSREQMNSLYSNIKLLPGVKWAA